MKLWRPDGRFLRALSLVGPAVRRCAFDATGTRLVAGGADGMIRVFDLTRAESRPLADHRGAVTTLTVSSRGTILSAGEDGQARVFPPRGGWATLQGHEGPINGGDVSPDGRLAVTAGADGTARIWTLDLSPPDARQTMLASVAPPWREIVAMLRARVRSCLSVAERRRYLGESDIEAGANFSACESSHDRVHETEAAAPVPAASNLAGILEEPVPPTTAWHVDSQRVTASGCTLELTRRFTLSATGERRTFVVRLDLSEIQKGEIVRGADPQRVMTEVERQEDYVSMHTVGGAKTIEFKMFDGGGGLIDHQFWNVLTTEIAPPAEEKAVRAMALAIAACRPR